MDFKLNETQTLLKDSVAGGLAPERLGDGAAQWRAMIELGLAGLLAGEAQGGAGLGPVECMIAATEVGRMASTAPFSSTAVAGALYSKLDDARAARRLAEIASGDVRASVAFVDQASDPDPFAIAAVAEKAPDGYVVSGAKWLVLDGADATLFVVAAREKDSGKLIGFEAPRASAGLSIRLAPLLDGRAAADLAFNRVHVPFDALLAEGEAFEDAYAHAFDIAALCACAETVGAMSAMVAMTAEYLRTRKQFGVALSTLQVIQHRLVDMRIALETAEAITAAAAMKLAGADVRVAQRHVDAAKTITDRAGRTVAQHCVQLHGAMGLTDECRASPFVKRVTANAFLMGDADFHARRFARLST